MSGYDFSGKYVFLSGPMTGMPEWNRKAFADAARKLRGAGAAWVYDPSLLAPAPGVPARRHERYMLATIAELADGSWDADELCNVPYYDVLALLPGWEGSAGARAERAVAEAIGVEVVEL